MSRAPSWVRPWFVTKPQATGRERVRFRTGTQAGHGRAHATYSIRPIPVPDDGRRRPGLGTRRGRLRDMDGGLRVQQGGSGEPVLLLLHGLGATSDVWDGWRPLLARRWPGRWLAPDLPGHGGSPSLTGYTFDGFAAALAPTIAAALPAAASVVVLGHSLGGVVGLCLASGEFGVP